MVSLRKGDTEAHFPFLKVYDKRIMNIFFSCFPPVMKTSTGPVTVNADRQGLCPPNRYVMEELITHVWDQMFHLRDSANNNSVWV